MCDAGLVEYRHLIGTNETAALRSGPSGAGPSADGALRSLEPEARHGAQRTGRPSQANDESRKSGLGLVKSLAPGLNSDTRIPVGALRRDRPSWAQIHEASRNRSVGATASQAS